jgi:hypothetical protein
MEIFQYTHTLVSAHRTMKQSKRTLESHPKRFASPRLMLVLELTVCSSNLHFGRLHQQQNTTCDVPICCRIPASHSYAAALHGHTNDDVMHVHECGRTPHLNQCWALVLVADCIESIIHVRDVRTGAQAMPAAARGGSWRFQELQISTGEGGEAFHGYGAVTDLLLHAGRSL